MTPAPQTQATQLQIREAQTREYDTRDCKMAMKAALNALQDMGYTVTNANADLGLLVASKEIDIMKTGEVAVMMLFALGGSRDSRLSYPKTACYECTVNVSEFGERTRIRANFRKKSFDNHREILVTKEVDDPIFYQEFFSKMDKSLFIGKQKI
jgi:hypothetical protein